MQPTVQTITGTTQQITITFDRPVFGTTITVMGVPTMGLSVEASNLTGTSVNFTNITLGVQYDFSLFAINKFGDQSVPTTAGVIGKL